MIRSPRFVAGIVLSFLLAATAASAESPLPVSPILGSQATLSVITEGPGKDLYLAFGHTALRVRDPERGMDLLFNYGTIDPAFLTNPSFLGRFLLGDLRYSLGIHRFQEALEYDIATQNRTWVEQVLNLTRDQKNAIYQFLLWNSQPENQSYQYDFIKDNCASRIPLVLEKVLGPVLVYPVTASGKVSTARNLIEASLSDRVPWNLLASLGLGAVANQPLTPRETSFMPESLRSLLAGSFITREGRPVPLVSAESTVYAAPHPKAPASPLDLGLALWVVSGVVIFLTLKGLTRKQYPTANRWWSEVPDRFLFAIVGAGGSLIFYLTFFSQHFAAQSNFHILWMWPTHLLIALMPWKGPWGLRMRWYWRAAVLVTVLFILLWPWWPQRSLGDGIPLLLILAARTFARSGVFETRPKSRKAPNRYTECDPKS